MWLKGVAFDWRFVAPFPFTVSVVVAAGLAIEHWLWRQPWATWYFKRPDLRGTWMVEMISSWKAREDDPPLPPIIGYIAVKQTFSSLQMHLMTSESESWLVAEAILPAPHGDSFRICAVYENRPNLKLRETGASPWKQGAFTIVTHGKLHRPEAANGDYWTDQKTNGTMALTDRRIQVLTRFIDCQNMWEPEKGEPERAAATLGSDLL